MYGCPYILCTIGSLGDRRSRDLMARDHRRMSDDDLLQRLARVLPPADVDAVRRALDRGHYSRYAFRAGGEQVARELADAWSTLGSRIKHLSALLPSVRPGWDMPGLADELRCASHLSTRVVAMVVSCIPGEDSGSRPRKDGRAQALLDNIHRDPYVPGLVHEMNAVTARLDYVIVTVSDVIVAHVRLVDQRRRWLGGQARRLDHRGPSGWGSDDDAMDDHTPTNHHRFRPMTDPSRPTSADPGLAEREREREREGGRERERERGREREREDVSPS